MRFHPLPLVLAATLGIPGCSRNEQASTRTETKASEPAYVTGVASSDGIGKFYHGREIAQVMGHPAIGWLERDEREREEAPSRAIDALDLAPSAVIADIGAGSG